MSRGPENIKGVQGELTIDRSLGNILVRLDTAFNPKGISTTKQTSSVSTGNTYAFFCNRPTNPGGNIGYEIRALVPGTKSRVGILQFPDGSLDGARYGEHNNGLRFERYCFAPREHSELSITSQASPGEVVNEQKITPEILTNFTGAVEYLPAAMAVMESYAGNA